MIAFVFRFLFGALTMYGVIEWPTFRYIVLGLMVVAFAVLCSLYLVYWPHERE